MSWLVKIGLIVLALYVVGAFALYALQRRMMFSPDPVRVLPSAVDLPGLEEVVLQTGEGHRLYSWHLPAQQGQPTILFFHGNGGNIAGREEKFRQLSQFGYGVFMLGYRGFGGSEGQPSEKVLVEDARLAYDYLIGLGVDVSSELVIYGESIGTSIAVQLAAQVKTAAVVLEAPMYSVLSIAEERYPYMPVKHFLKDKFETDRFIHLINCPLLIVHGSEDEVITPASGRRLFEAAPEPKRFQLIEGAGHNDLYDFPIVSVIASYLREIGLDQQR